MKLERRIKKILWLLAIYVVVVFFFCVISYFTLDGDSNFTSKLTSGVTSGGIVLLFNIASIFMTKMIATVRPQASPIFKKAAFTKSFDPEFHLGLGIMIIFFLILLVVIWAGESSPAEKTWGTILSVVTIILLLSALTRRRLIFSEKGIEYFDEFGKVEASWENISEIIKDDSKMDYLVASNVKYCLFWIIPISEYDIPLSAFDKNWRTGEIGKIIEENTSLIFIDNEKDKT